MGEHVFWITSRAAGISALLAASAAVALGLLMGGRMSKRRDLRVLHEALSLATLVALAVHALSLLGDSYLSPSLADVTIPFASSYERLWMGVGLVAAWLFQDGLVPALQGPISIHLLGGADLSWLAGILVAGGTYLALDKYAATAPAIASPAE